MEESGLSQTGAAHALGCSASYVSRMKGRYRIPDLRVALALERVTADWSGGPIVPSEWAGVVAAAEPKRARRGRPRKAA